MPTGRLEQHAIFAEAGELEGRRVVRVFAGDQNISVTSQADVFSLLAMVCDAAVETWPATNPKISGDS